MAQCGEMGVEFDSWQHGIGAASLGKRADGKYAATVGGIVLSIPRQVGKTFLVGMIVIALCVLFPGLTVVWSAHRARTSTKTFSSLKGITSRKKIAIHMLDPRNSNGEQELRFRNGSVIMFGAREQGFGRGFDEIDVEVFDEAQILTEKALEDMVPATNQSRQESGALLFFMGTPPRPIDPGEEFTARRSRALGGKAKNMVYVEFSADEDAAPDDHAQWRKANPSFPTRTPLESMERMREQLTDEESFRREALGIWPDPKSVGIIPAKKWAGGAVRAGAALTTPVVAVDFKTGVEQSFAIVVAGSLEQNDTEKPAVDVARYEQGFGQNWSGQHIIDQTLEVCGGLGVDQVVVDVYGDGNALLIPKFEEVGLRVVKLNTVDMRNASVGLRDAVMNSRLLHVVSPASPPLDVAVAGAATRKSGPGFVWAPEKATADLTPLRAASAALWVLHTSAEADYDLALSVF